MRLIREWSVKGRKLKHIEYEWRDANLLKERFIKISPKILDELCKSLKRKRKKVQAIDCYDGASGWYGTDFMIGRANLSYNGYCLSDDSIKTYISGGQDKMWYNISDPEYKKLSKA
ncbi:MAG: hypothetical protein NXH86_04075 [Flavobacteriaceae bacterium]|uniref:hypothetical protein n=1 Tax=Flagellimonas sp. SN16 TaxID=3415142 RepID=UPI003C64D35F|nr:hypothetical protein [Flavobacteriaceae bacterium]